MLVVGLEFLTVHRLLLHIVTPFAACHCTLPIVRALLFVVANHSFPVVSALYLAEDVEASLSQNSQAKKEGKADTEWHQYEIEKKIESKSEHYDPSVTCN
ncbi:hypothetical protein ABFX02_03G007000 [Erythranthe guttata]